MLYTHTFKFPDLTIAKRLALLEAREVLARGVFTGGETGKTLSPSGVTLRRFLLVVHLL